MNETPGSPPVHYYLPTNEQFMYTPLLLEMAHILSLTGELNELPPYRDRGDFESRCEARRQPASTSWCLGGGPETAGHQRLVFIGWYSVTKGKVLLPRIYFIRLRFYA